MDLLTVNVAGLLQESSGTSRRVEVNGFIPGWDGFTFVAPLEGEIELCRAGKGIVVRSSLNATIEQTCCRCLECYDQEVHVSFDEMYYPVFDLATGKAMRLEYDGIDEEFLIENVDQFDLSEAIRQHIEISQPLMPRCQADCLGICPECGADRNSALCNCEEKVVDIRMAPIREMLRQMGENRSA